jgi:hypothetical protein
MRSLGWTVATAALALTALAACNGQPSRGAENSEGRGRYAGVGIYSATPKWMRLVTGETAKSPDSARPVDDQVIIVVTDSHTGELRACGDLSGYCVGMNPWAAGLARSQIAPVRVTTHALAPGDEPTQAVTSEASAKAQSDAAAAMAAATAAARGAPH